MTAGTPLEPPPAEHRTLYVAHLSDPRERAAQPGEAKRRRTARKAEQTSDVTRFRGLLLAAIVGGVVSVATALATSAPGSFSSPGPLSRPHAKAGLSCASCHAEDPAKSGKTALASVAAGASAACVGCHGGHASTRPGHARLASQGEMVCATCHTVHRGEQGVTFPQEGPAVRWGAGAEAELALSSFRPAVTATVPIVRASSCEGCHDVASRADPIARCLVPGQEALGAARPVVCFDEHALALPPDLVGDRLRPGGVCAGQHAPDRALAWEAARDAAIATPEIRGAGLTGGPWTWLAAGFAASAITLSISRLRDGRRRRKRAQAEAPAVEAMIRPAERVRLPSIDASRCLGCYACVDACPYDVLEVRQYVAVVARPDACCGLSLCEQRCPNGSLSITDGDKVGDRPRIADDLQSLDTKGVYLAGDITGLPLIKNAILQGERAASAIAEALRAEGRAGEGALDLVIVGAGPAGISAALRAKELGLAYQVLEQGSVAQSIQSFPRGKLVFDQPLELPLSGKLWLRESSKEELLSHWLRIVRRERLAVAEDTRMTGVRKLANGLFMVTAEPREGGPATELRTRRVLLAVGQRGTPRRLPIELAPEVEGRVHYHLADAKSFEGKRVLVAGLGDVAMEAAIALARQPGTRVTVVHRGATFTRGKARNIEEMQRMAQKGTIDLRLGTTIAGLSPERARLVSTDGEREHGYDAVLVMIGSIPPWEVLKAAGVSRVGDEAG